MPHKDDARYWRSRAAATRALINSGEGGAKDVLLEMVRGYEVLATVSEQRALGRQNLFISELLSSLETRETARL